MSQSSRTVETLPGSKDNAVEISETRLIRADGNVEGVTKGKKQKRLYLPRLSMKRRWKKGLRLLV